MAADLRAASWSPAGNFPDETQGDYLLNNDIGFQGILRYRVKEDGSGFAADAGRAAPAVVRPELPPGRPRVRPRRRPLRRRLVQPADRPHAALAPRPEPRRRARPDLADHTTRSRPLVEKPKIAGATVPELLDLLKAYEDRTRYRARRELREHPPKAGPGRRRRSGSPGSTRTTPTTGTTCSKPSGCHQSLDVVDRAAAEDDADLPRAQGPGRGHPRPLLLARPRRRPARDCSRKQVNDENPRVRLEAVRALSFFDGKDAAKAQEIALESLAPWTRTTTSEYTLDETNKTLERRAKAESKK